MRVCFPVVWRHWRDHQIPAHKRERGGVSEIHPTFSSGADRRSIHTSSSARPQIWRQLFPEDLRLALRLSLIRPLHPAAPFLPLLALPIRNHQWNRTVFQLSSTATEEHPNRPAV